MHAPHTLTRSEKQLSRRAAGTTIYVFCPTCAGLPALYTVSAEGTQVGTIHYRPAGEVQAVYTNEHGYSTDHRTDSGEDALRWLQDSHTYCMTTKQNDESAIANESPSQGQTVAPADSCSNTAATETMNSDDHQPDLNDVLRQLVDDSIRDLVEEIAGKAGIRRPSSLQLALVYNEISKAAAAGRDRAARAALNSSSTGAELARALGVSRQAVHKKYAS